MRQKWKFAVVYAPPDGTYALGWDLHEDQKPGLLGGLQEDRMTVTFGVSDLDRALDYITWHRAFIPKDVTLYLFDANLEVDCILRPEMSKADLWALICGTFEC